MHRIDPELWKHSHDYGVDTSMAERRNHVVIGITITMMAIEIAAGAVFNSMALLADGWHMSTHVVAFLITALAYYFSRRHSANPRYSFGTGKMGVLGAFASAVLLAVVALLMAGESMHRIFIPQLIHFDEAIGVAVIGLAVNAVCALLLKQHHHGSRGDGHHEYHAGHDLNLHSAYVHVLADALTSVTAIIALLAGKFFAWNWLDPVMGLVGSAAVALWAWNLLRETSGILLDRTPESCDLREEICGAVESSGDAVVTDLHLWQVAAGKFSAIVSIAAHQPKSPETYREMFREHEELVHVTVEVQQCRDHEILPREGRQSLTASV